MALENVANLDQSVSVDVVESGLRAELSGERLTVALNEWYRVRSASSSPPSRRTVAAAVAERLGAPELKNRLHRAMREALSGGAESLAAGGVTDSPRGSPAPTGGGGPDTPHTSEQRFATLLWGFVDGLPAYPWDPYELLDQVVQALGFDRGPALIRGRRRRAGDRTLDQPMSSERLRELLHTYYIHACETYGPMVADRSLAAAVEAANVVGGTEGLSAWDLL